jgi:hypothetical protein
MYTYANPFVDKYKQMKEILTALLPFYVMETGKSLVAARVVEEFANMEVARAEVIGGGTITGESDPPKAIVQYLEHHFKGGAKPVWYKNLTE